jgi:hypothetical protein
MGALTGGGGIAGAIDTVAGGGGGAAGFDAALTAARTAVGGQDAQIEKMIESGVGVMGGMMMRLASEVLNQGMEDDGE